MFGLIVGTVCLVALVGTVRRRRYNRGHYGHHWRWHHHRGGRARNPLHLLFARLDTTPGQEKAIMTALGTLRERMEESRKELDAVAKDLALVVGSAVLDDKALDGVKARTDTLFGRFSTDLRSLFALVHDALDDEQRRKFAELINDGSLFHAYCDQAGTLEHGCGPSYGYRHYHHGYAC